MIQCRRKDADGWRLPAEKLECLIVQQVIKFLGNRSRLFQLAGPDDGELSVVENVTETIGQLIEQLQSNQQHETREILRSLVRQVTVRRDEIAIEINREGLASQLTSAESETSNEPFMINMPVRLCRRGVRTRLILEQDAQTSPDPDPALVRLLSEAWHYRGGLMSGQYHSLGELAETSDKTSNEISRILPLAFLAPDIVRQILEGSQPAELTAHSLKRTRPLPIRWTEQRQRLGFTAKG